MRGRDVTNFVAEKRAELSQLENFQAATVNATVSECIQDCETHFTIDRPPLSPCVHVHHGNYRVTISKRK